MSILEACYAWFGGVGCSGAGVSEASFVSPLPGGASLAGGHLQAANVSCA
jgi:hypothetical protein